MNKLWLIVKHVQSFQHGQDQSEEQKSDMYGCPKIRNNIFYLKGGEKLKIGRVVMKVVDISIEDQASEHEASDHKTEMSLGEIQLEEVKEE